jgi:hypothetical protein
MPASTIHEEYCNELAKNIRALYEYRNTLQRLKETLLREGWNVLPQVREELGTITKDVRTTKKEIARIIKNLEVLHSPYANQDAFNAMCKERGSPAVLDREFGGGIVTLTIEEERMKDLATLIQAYEEADNNSPASLWKEWRNLKTYTKPKIPLEAYILSYNNDPQMRKSSDKILEDLGRIGLRPATLEELILLGIVHPEFNKRDDKSLLGLTKYEVSGGSYVPTLSWDGGKRYVRRNWWDGEWLDRVRFVCVRK